MSDRSWNVRLTCLLLLCANLPALAQVNWPNAPAPCNDPSSLQLCVESQPDGSIIEINAGSINATQALDVDQSLTIRAANGFSPVFEQSVSFNFENNSGPVAVTLEGLRFVSLELEVNQSNGNAQLDFAFRNNVVESVFSRAIRISGSSESASEPIQYIIENNVIRSEQRDGSVVTVFSAWSSGNEGLIRNNLFETFDNAAGGVLDIRGPIGRLTDMSVDVIGNRFQGVDYNAGVIFRSEEGGRLDGRIINNLAFGQDGGENITAALVVEPSDNTAEGNVWIINNTLVDNVSGIAVRTQSAPDVRTFIYNNIVANSTEQNFRVVPGSVVMADYNLGFAPGVPDEFAPGPNFIDADPLFIANDDPQPQAGSPAIDSGDSSIVPADIVSDFAGNGRILGVRVDRGAFEWVQPFPESVAVPTLNNVGRITLALFFLLLAFFFRPKS